MTHTDTHDPDIEAGQADADQAQAVERLLDASGEAQAREALTAAGNRAGLQHLDRILARRRAAELLKQGQPLPVAREQLMSERGLSRRTAYRILEAAAALLGLRTTTDPQPESPTMSTTEATHDPAAEAATDSTTDTGAPQDTAAANAAQAAEPLVLVDFGNGAAPAPSTDPQLIATQPSPSAGPVRVRITHLRAPWPDGASAGNVVEFPSGAVPAWALGKCAAVDSATPADFVHQPPKPAVPVTASAGNWDMLTLTGSTPEGQRAELDRLRAQLATAEAQAAELAPKLAAALDEQRRTAATAGAPAPHAAPLGRVPDMEQAHAAHDAASREANRLEVALRSVRQRVQTLTAAVDRLALQVSAPDRLAPALDARNAAARRVQDADADVARLADAIKRLDTELSTEETAQAETRRHAAALLLERARTGQSLDDVATPNEGRLNALREARAGAVEAHAEAQRVAAAARAERDRAGREVFAVLADQQLAEFQAAYARMLEAAGEWVARHVRATGQAPGLPNIMGDVQRAIDRATAHLDSLEA